MANVFEWQAYSFGLPSVPYIVMSIGVAAVLLYVLFTRGNPVTRGALIALGLFTLAFSVAQSFALAATNPRVAEWLYRAYTGFVAFIGPAVLACQLSLDDRLDRHRRLVAVSVAGAAVSATLCWTTDLVVVGTWKTPWGFYFLDNGPLNEAHVLVNLVAWGLVGSVIVARASRAYELVGRRRRVQRFALVGVLASLGGLDTLLGRGIGVYPASWVVGIAAVGVCAYAFARADILRVRGRDWATAWELLLVAALALAAFGLHRASAGLGAGQTVVLVAALPVLMVGGQSVVRTLRHRQVEQHGVRGHAAAPALELYGAVCAQVDSIPALVKETVDFLDRHLGLSRIHLLGIRDGTMHGIGKETELADRSIDPAVAQWLVANPRPIVRDRLISARLGEQRERLLALVDQLDAEVALPLLDREVLTGFITAGPRESDRAISDTELDILAQVQRVAARALTYLHLIEEAERRIEVAREVEVATAVAHARTRGRGHKVHDGWAVRSFYEPAGHLGADWWMSADLPDGRVLVAIGAVAGSGVPAALVTATVEGCCETTQRMLGANFEILSLIQLLNRSVGEVGHGQYIMSCFAAVLDRESNTATYANAGHPFPYVVRRGDDDAVELKALVSKGTPLGVEANPRITVAQAQLGDRDFLVMMTDSLVDSENLAGDSFGERRVQRALRTLGAESPDKVCEQLVRQAKDHCGTRPPRGDFTVVSVHPIV